MIDFNALSNFDAIHLHKVDDTYGQGNWQAMLRVKESTKWLTSFGFTIEDAITKALRDDH